MDSPDAKDATDERRMHPGKHGARAARMLARVEVQVIA
jgi:hypothetical protein